MNCRMDKFGTLDSDETIAIGEDRRWPQSAQQEGDKNKQKLSTRYVIHGKCVMSAQTLEVSLIRSRNGWCCVSKGMRGQ